MDRWQMVAYLTLRTAGALTASAAVFTPAIAQCIVEGWTTGPYTLYSHAPATPPSRGAHAGVLGACLEWFA
jgi:hypothetical protein